MGRSVPSIVISRIINDATMHDAFTYHHSPSHETTAFQGVNVRGPPNGNRWPGAMPGCGTAGPSGGRRSPPMPAALPLPARKPPERGPYQPYEEVWRVQADDDRSGERTGGAGQAERGNDRPVAGQRKPRAGRGGVRRPHACPDPDSAGRAGQIGRAHV